MPVQVNQEVEVHQHDQRSTISNQYDQRSNVHNTDQRSVNVYQQEVHQHDQRTVVLDNRSMQVGMEPILVQQREGALRAEAFQAVSQLQSRNQEIERNASQSLQQLEQSFSMQMSRAEDLNRQLMNAIDHQSQQLEEQRRREEELRNMVVQLQNQLVVAKHAPPTIPPVAHESQNGTDPNMVDVSALMNDMRQVRQELRMVKQLSTIPVTYKTPNASEVPLVPQPMAQPPVSPVSACAGIPPSGSGSGSPSFIKQASSGRDFWSMTTPTPAAGPPGSLSSSSSSDGRVNHQDGQGGGHGSPGGDGPPSSHAFPKPSMA